MTSPIKYHGWTIYCYTIGDKKFMATNGVDVIRAISEEEIKCQIDKRNACAFPP